MDSKNVKKITRQSLMNIMRGNTNFYLLDVMDEEKYKDEHIPGSINIPLNKIDEYAETHGEHKREIFIVYSENFDCDKSTRAAVKLQKHGFINVFDYKGGLDDYIKTGFPLIGRIYDYNFIDAMLCKINSF